MRFFHDNKFDIIFIFIIYSMNNIDIVNIVSIAEYMCGSVDSELCVCRQVPLGLWEECVEALEEAILCPRAGKKIFRLQIRGRCCVFQWEKLTE